jgi:hypothetical protein
MTPIRANIVGPSCSATSSSAAIGACHSGVVFGLGQLGDVERGVAERDYPGSDLALDPFRHGMRGGGISERKGIAADGGRRGVSKHLSLNEL